MSKAIELLKWAEDTLSFLVKQEWFDPEKSSAPELIAEITEHLRDQYKSIAVHTITFYRYNEDGNVLQDKDGNDIQFECNVRLKALEHICDDMQMDYLDEIKEGE
jgi:hypothetical protein